MATVNPLTGEGSLCDAADRCVYDQACPFVAGCSKVGGLLTAVDRAEVALVEAVDGTPLTPMQEWELYLAHGVVPSVFAIQRALREGEDRDEVLAMMDRRAAQRAAEARP